MDGLYNISTNSIIRHHFLIIFNQTANVNYNLQHLVREVCVTDFALDPDLGDGIQMFRQHVLVVGP